MGEPPVLSRSEAPVRHVIKRYSNRKLYDTLRSRYVTLVQVADMVRAGEEVQIIDNATKLDKTEFTMALIISEELKESPRTIPLDTLKALIQNRCELLTGRRSAEQQSNPEQPASHRVDKNEQLTDPVQVQMLQSQVSSLRERIAELERRLAMS